RRWLGERGLPLHGDRRAADPRPAAAAASAAARVERARRGAGLLPPAGRLEGDAQLLQPALGCAADAGARVQRRGQARPYGRANASPGAAALKARRQRAESGSALVEAAIVIPCLVLIVFWSAGLTDMLVLKLKAAEALRYALWESTVFKPPRQVAAEIQQRFADLRSPRQMNAPHTGLLLHPLPRDRTWRAGIDFTTAEAHLGGDSRLAGAGGPWDRFVDALGGVPGRSVDAAARTMKLNTRGVALARVSLVRSRPRTAPELSGSASSLE